MIRIGAKKLTIIPTTSKIRSGVGAGPHEGCSSVTGEPLNYWTQRRPWGDTLHGSLQPPALTKREEGSAKHGGMLTSHPSRFLLGHTRGDWISGRWGGGFGLSNTWATWCDESSHGFAVLHLRWRLCVRLCLLLHYIALMLQLPMKPDNKPQPLIYPPKRAALGSCRRLHWNQLLNLQSNGDGELAFLHQMGSPRREHFLSYLLCLRGLIWILH